MLIFWAVLGGFLLDAVFGDPVWLLHPVVLMGRCIAALEKRRSHYRSGMLGALVLVLLSGRHAYKAISQYGFSSWLDTQLDSPVYMVLTILIVAGLLAGGIASMISVRREGKKIKELKRRRMIEE